MKLLPDECVARDFKHDLKSHDVSTVDEAGFKGLKNGELLRAASGVFDVLVTVDQNLPFQQNIHTPQLAVIIIVAKGITYEKAAPDSVRRNRRINRDKTRRIHAYRG
ncbi:MAG TPA: DUF5615 family PIN-like protein [Pyrinomonadaceae bacterium]|jgi:hypothetical protein|nr:DUF5615 family PIN-like protein [Pyrinomonadaceae bacterium]